MRKLPEGNHRLAWIQADAAFSDHDDSQPHPAKPTRQPEDVELLDAYSRAVIRVVESVSPAVIGVAPRADRRGGAGSGFVIATDGYALTNSHVVHGRTRLVATTSDGDRLDAELIGDDPTTDLALIRVAARELPATELGDSDVLRVGQLVIAMGDPFGFQSTVSTGVVSAVGRAMRGRDGRLIENVIQHSAPLNPGNSGGPLVDSHGRVVGINTAIIAFAQGLGFAIPAGTAQWVIGELMQHGRVRRPYLGVAATVVHLPCLLVRELDLLGDRGVQVVSLEEGGPAAAGGVRPGDVIVAVNDRVITSVDDLHRLLTDLKQQSRLVLTVIRNHDKLERQVTPAVRGEQRR